MTYEEALTFIKGTGVPGITPGLSRVTELLERLGRPQEQFRCVHIAGTNGKGSAAVMLASVLQAAGYRTGLFTSPYLVRYQEQIRVDGEEISEEAFCLRADTVQAAMAGMRETPSEFERVVSMAFLHFAQESCEIVVIETGMGGRLDATNVFERTEVDVLTHIAMDHTAFLGDSIEQIAGEKAGIIQDGADVVLQHQTEEVEAVIRERCGQMNAELLITDPSRMIVGAGSIEGQYFSYRGRRDLFLPLSGVYQRDNAMTVLDAVDVLSRKGWQITDEAVREGLARVKWPGRFEILQKRPLVLLDGAHNEDGIIALARTLDAYLPGQKIHFVFGVLADKNYRAMLRHILPHACEIIAANPDNPRALSAENLCAVIREYADELAVCEGGTIRDSVRKALKHCPEDGVICILGSLYQAGDARAMFPQETDICM